MGRRTKASFQKRQREKRKAEKAERKREERARRSEEPSQSEQVADEDELAGYGIAPEEPEDNPRHGG